MRPSLNRSSRETRNARRDRDRSYEDNARSYAENYGSTTYAGSNVGPLDRDFDNPQRPYENDYDEDSSYASSRDNDLERDFYQRQPYAGPRRNFAGVGPKGYKRSDERIREDASEALYHDPNVDASNIEVEVKDGVITLSGTVDSRQTKRQAEECVEHIFGVKDVANTLRVEKNPAGSQATKSRGGAH